MPSPALTERKGAKERKEKIVTTNKIPLCQFRLPLLWRGLGRGKNNNYEKSCISI